MRGTRGRAGTWWFWTWLKPVLSGLEQMTGTLERNTCEQRLEWTSRQPWLESSRETRSEPVSRAQMAGPVARRF